MRNMANSPAGTAVTVGGRRLSLEDVGAVSRGAELALEPGAAFRGRIAKGAKVLADAIAWMKKWPALDANGNVRLEIRPLYEAEDFGEAFTAEARAREDRLRAELAAKQN